MDKLKSERIWNNININMNLKDLAKSEYCQILINDYQKEMSGLMQPDSIPENDLTDVKAHKKMLYFLQDKIKTLQRLRGDKNEIDIRDSYE